MQKINDFIARWQTSGGSEQANSQLFLAELCAVLDLPPPDPAKPVNEENTYSFERKVYIPRGDGTSELKKLDLYRQGSFVLESKQGQLQAESPLRSRARPVPGLPKEVRLGRTEKHYQPD